MSNSNGRGSLKTTLTEHIGNLGFNFGLMAWTSIALKDTVEGQSVLNPDGLWYGTMVLAPMSLILQMVIGVLNIVVLYHKQAVEENPKIWGLGLPQAQLIKDILQFAVGALTIVLAVFIDEEFTNLLHRECK